MKFYRPYWVLAPIPLLNAIHCYTRLTQCPTDLFGVWYITFGLLILLAALTHFHMDHQLNWRLLTSQDQFSPTNKYTNFLLVILVILIIWTLIGGVLFLYILVSDNLCMSLDQLILYSIFFLAFGVTFFLVAFYFAMWFRGLAEQTRLERARERVYRSVYDKIENDPDFDPVRLARENADVLEGVGLREEDFKALRKHCEVKFVDRVGWLKKFGRALTRGRRQASEGEEDDMDPQSPHCSICRANFIPGEMVFRHPICGHLYHWDCIEYWLRQKQTCAMCRRNTRPALIEYLIEKRLKRG